MENGFDLLHNDMLADIARCLDLEHPEKENVESCFFIARNYWTRLQSLVRLRGFENDGDEIRFYRKVKPNFASHIEYFSLLAEGLMFVPPWVPLPEDLQGKIEESAWRRTWQESVNDFWRQEEIRGNRFYRKNQALLDYCASGCNEHDQEYFLPRNIAVSTLSLRRSHNRDTELFTPYEEILTTWHAYKMYSQHIKRRVNEPVSS